MIKFVVQFRQPTDLNNFENTYNDFLALVENMPDIVRRQVVHITGTPIGQSPYYRALELYFDTVDAMRGALMSPAGQEAGNELARFGDGTFEVFFAEVFEEAGGSTPHADTTSTESDTA